MELSGSMKWHSRRCRGPSGIHRFGGCLTPECCPSYEESYRLLAVTPLNLWEGPIGVVRDCQLGVLTLTRMSRKGCQGDLMGYMTEHSSAEECLWNVSGPHVKSGQTGLSLLYEGIMLLLVDVMWDQDLLHLSSQLPPILVLFAP